MGLSISKIYKCLTGVLIEYNCTHTKSHDPLSRIKDCHSASGAESICAAVPVSMVPSLLAVPRVEGLRFST